MFRHVGVRPAISGTGGTAGLARRKCRRSYSPFRQFQLSDLVAMYLVGPVRQTQGAGMGVGARKTEVVANSRASVGLYGPVDNLAGHHRRRHLDQRDLGSRGLVAD